MKVTINGLRIIGKKHREGIYKSGPNAGEDWERYMVECANGEGSSVTLECSKELHDKIVPFLEYTGEADVWQRGFNLDGELTEVYED